MYVSTVIAVFSPAPKKKGALACSPHCRAQEEERREINMEEDNTGSYFQSIVNLASEGGRDGKYGCWRLVPNGVLPSGPIKSIRRSKVVEEVLVVTGSFIGCSRERPGRSPG